MTGDPTNAGPAAGGTAVRCCPGSPGTSPKPESTEGMGIAGVIKGCKGAPLNLG